MFLAINKMKKQLGLKWHIRDRVEENVEKLRIGIDASSFCGWGGGIDFIAMRRH